MATLFTMGRHMYQYDPKRYRIAPWKGHFGDQAHAKRVNPHLQKIRKVIEDKKREMLRLQEQVHQLEELEKNSRGRVIKGILVSEADIGGEHYGLSIVTVKHGEKRSAKIYPNAHNGGKTFGLHIYWDGYPFTRDEWRGAGHSYEEAVEGARAWVLEGKRLAKRVDRTDGTIVVVP